MDLAEAEEDAVDQWWRRGRTTERAKEDDERDEEIRIGGPRRRRFDPLEVTLSAARI